MPIDWAPFVEFVQKHQRFLIMTHVRPDGDAVGSEVGLACALKQLGKSARVVIASMLYDRYAFLNTASTPVEQFRLPGDEFTNIDAIIIVDTGTWNQLGEFGPFMRSLNVTKAVIDHHRTQDDLGGLRFVDTSAEAAGRLIYEATMALGVPVTEEAANALYTALATDTGWFRHASTTPQSFALAERLVTAGAKPTKIYEHIYEQNTLAKLRLTGRALDRLKAEAGGRIVYTEIYLRDYTETEATPPDTEDLINYPRGVTGAEMAMVFIEQPPGGTKVSFRCKEPLDVSKLAEQFGGGGHKLAAGASLMKTLPETQALVLAAARALLQ